MISAVNPSKILKIHNKNFLNDHQIENDLAFDVMDEFLWDRNMF